MKFEMLAALAGTLLLGASPQQPLATPSPDAIAERYYALAREAWRNRTDVPYLHYGARVRYEHHFHVFIDWWDAYLRTSDGRLAETRIHDPVDENERNAGAPISIFGFTFADTNPYAEKIDVDDPAVLPTYSFGLQPRTASVEHDGLSGDASRDPGGLKQIAVVAASSRAYDVRYAGTSRIGTIDAIHLTFTALRDPKDNRIRELWLDPATYRTLQVRVQGLLDGKPFDGVSWLAQYVQVEDRNYLERVVADQPLHFGVNTLVTSFEFDFFDYHFPATVPQLTFDSKLITTTPLNDRAP